MTSDATTCSICDCTHACHDGVAKPSRIKDQMREQEEERLSSMKRKNKLQTSYKNHYNRDTVLAERGVKQTQEQAKTTKVESYEYKDHKSSISLFICRPCSCFKVLIQLYQQTYIK